jgi:predicted nucleic acid-binding protein
MTALETAAERAAELRARYHLRTPDALQVATALLSDCQAFLTNDKDLSRIIEIQVLVLETLL